MATGPLRGREDTCLTNIWEGASRGNLPGYPSAALLFPCSYWSCEKYNLFVINNHQLFLLAEAKNFRKKGAGAGGVLQVVELLPSKHEALNSNPDTIKK
jgi:hypothetical protein